MTVPQVLLIGGTSHVGKSTLARTLSERVGWQCVSTDSLAKHPGRPWATLQRAVPDHVAKHYRELSVGELLGDVLAHYDRLWPTIEEMVTAHLNRQAAPGIVIEGSAVWPEFAASITNERVAKVWLTAPSEFLKDRIVVGSRMESLGEPERLLVRKFIARTLVYDRRMRAVVERLGLPLVPADRTASELADAVAAVCGLR